MKKILALGIALIPMALHANVTSKNEWIRSSTGPNGALFLEIANDSPTLEVLVDAKIREEKTSKEKICDHMELHTHKHEDGKMMMRQVSSIDVPAEGATELKPGGLHIMLMGLNGPLEEGRTIPVSLTFQSGKVLNIDVPVKSASTHHH